MADCLDAGVKAYFDWRNSEGGVHGRKLVLAVQLDDQLGQNQQQALLIVSQNDVFGAFSAALLASGWKDIGQAGIPLYTDGINFNERNGEPGMYGNLPVLCVSCVSPYSPHAAIVANAKKIATLGYGIAQASKDCVTSNVASVEKFAGKTGQSIVYKNDAIDYGMANGIAPEVTAMKNAGVEMVVSCIDLSGVKTLEQEMERQGIGKVPVFQTNGYDAEFMKSVGDLFEGDIVGVSFRPFEANGGKSQLEKYREWMGKSGQGLTEESMRGWIVADLAYQGILAAGPGFTRESVIAATNKMTAFTAGGLTGPTDWSRQHEPWTDQDPVTHGYAKVCLSYVRVKNQQFELIGDKDKPFSCWDPNLSQWTEPTSNDFQ
jgi:branched-chain amino acid transport system substrate-binding protein